MTQLKPNTLLDDKFRILKHIASGGMGSVYRGLDLELSRDVAIKILSDNSDEFVERFLREAKSMAALDHPNIVPIYAAGTHENSKYLVMKLVSGVTLEEKIKRQRLELETQFSWQDVVKIFRASLSALDHAHRRGILHRDIKPSNIMIDQNYEPVLMDFGLVRRIDEAKITQTGTVYGTPEYMSPEQVKGEAASTSSDLYSMGVVLFELLTQRLPFPNDSIYSTLLAQLKTPAPDPREINPMIPTWLSKITLRCLEKSPSDRYASANDVLDALTQGMNTSETENRNLMNLKAPPIIIERNVKAATLNVGQYQSMITKVPKARGFDYRWLLFIMPVFGALLYWLI